MLDAEVDGIDLSEQHLQKYRNASNFQNPWVSQFKGMAKVISTLVTIILLVVANQAATHFKRMGMLPEGKEAQPEYNGSNEVYMAAYRQHPVPKGRWEANN